MHRLWPFPAPAQQDKKSSETGPVPSSLTFKKKTASYILSQQRLKNKFRFRYSKRKRKPSRSTFTKAAVESSCSGWWCWPIIRRSRPWLSSAKVIEVCDIFKHIAVLSMSCQVLMSLCCAGKGPVASAGTCRFCGATGTSGMLAIGNICNDKECQVCRILSSSYFCFIGAVYSMHYVCYISTRLRI